MILQEYFRQTSLHGFKYIVDTSKHWTERIFWCICCVLSWSLCLLLMRSSWLQAKERPVAFLADTSYLSWTTRFPAVTICETGNLYNANNFSANEYAVFQEICFFTGRLKFVRHHCQGENHSCPRDGYLYLANKMRNNCTSMIKNCTWKNNPFECCEHFVPLKTEYGECYTINNIQMERVSSLDMSMNKSNGKGVLKFEVFTEESKVFIHSRDDIPNHVMEAGVYMSVVKGYAYSAHLSVVVTVSEPGVRGASIEARDCRFHDEVTKDHVYQDYSFTSCIISCRRKAFMNICGCLPHTQPLAGTSDYNILCNMTGLLCVSEHYNELYVISSEHSARLKKSLRCDCLPSCDNQIIQLLEQINTESSNENSSQIEIVVPFLPTEKFTRVSVKGKLDIVVAVGSLAGLFLGASLLSVLECVHFIIIRPAFGKIKTMKLFKK